MYQVLQNSKQGGAIVTARSGSRQESPVFLLFFNFVFGYQQSKFLSHMFNSLSLPSILSKIILKYPWVRVKNVCIVLNHEVYR